MNFPLLQMESEAQTRNPHWTFIIIKNFPDTLENQILIPDSGHEIHYSNPLPFLFNFREIRNNMRAFGDTQALNDLDNLKKKCIGTCKASASSRRSSSVFIVMNLITRRLSEAATTARPNNMKT